MNVQPAPPSPSPPAAHRPFAGVILGLLLVLFGLTWLANAVGLTQLHDALRDIWPWPAILVIIGSSLLLRTNRKPLPGVVLILLGAFVWARHQGLLEVSVPAVFAPSLLVIIGASVVWGALARSGPVVHAGPYVRVFAVLSSDEVRPALPFQGAQVAALMGSARLDLSRASMAGDTATIDVSLLMGNAEINVPPDWEVVLEVVPFMGGCVDKRRAPSSAPTRRLVVRGSALMAGVAIKD